jgi:hypothetical protein
MPTLTNIDCIVLGMFLATLFLAVGFIAAKFSK